MTDIQQFIRQLVEPTTRQKGYDALFTQTAYLVTQANLAFGLCSFLRSGASCVVSQVRGQVGIWRLASPVLRQALPSANRSRVPPLTPSGLLFIHLNHP